MSTNTKEIQSEQYIVLGDTPIKIIEAPGKITFLNEKNENGITYSGKFDNLIIKKDLIDYFKNWHSPMDVSIASINSHISAPYQQNDIYKNITQQEYLNDISELIYKEQRQEGVWIKNDEKKSVFEPDETLRKTFCDLTYRFGILYPTEKNPYTTLMYGEDDEKVPYRYTFDIKENADKAEQIVANTIGHFYDRKDASLFHINNYISSQITELYQEKDIWIKNNDKQYELEPDEKLKHFFGNTVVKFEIIYPRKLNPEPTLICKGESDEFDDNRSVFDIKGNIDTVKQLVRNAIQHFDPKKNANVIDIGEYLNSKTMELRHGAEFTSPQDFMDTVQLAKKAGYVQGVCECVAAIGEDHNLGKKLLSEMNVTKDMAKKFANPETYKDLEQGIFAPQQSLEQTHSIKR